MRLTLTRKYINGVVDFGAPLIHPDTGLADETHQRGFPLDLSCSGFIFKL